VDEVEAVPWEHAGAEREAKDLGEAAGSVRTGMRHYVIPNGKLGGRPHCHAAEEEFFVVLDGDGACLLGDEEIALRRGSMVGRPRGTGVAHAFRGPLTLLTYGFSSYILVIAITAAIFVLRSCSPSGRRLTTTARVRKSAMVRK